MQLVTAEWLHERGGLHDASVDDIRWNGSSLEVHIDDEWKNERGLGLSENASSPGFFLIMDAASQGDPLSVIGGWISEIRLVQNGLGFQMTDCDPIVIAGSSIRWTSTQ